MSVKYILKRSKMDPKSELQSKAEKVFKKVSEEAKIAEVVCDYFDRVNKGEKPDKKKMAERCSSAYVTQEILSLCEFVDFLVAVRDIKKEEGNT